MDHPMPSGRGAITLPTADHGDVTLPEPSWCAGHTDHRPDTERVDLAHSGPDVVLKFRGRVLSTACLDQAPFAEDATRDVQVSESLYGKALDARGVYELAATLDTYADRLRSLADQLLVILAGEDQ
ncbi:MULTISPECIES: DUF6907 domain-containing protein [Streptomyces rochei group]|uniref:DUF6907 domain-containing protein n=1 Tax=Streptomyces rochei group TaxID=2867164 RepID=UPI001982EEF1|nr:hypothetical protein [Streptomyces vinaceusdrappus]GHC26911.1 hypothetical protein GCM10010308_49750 [Streptomyces vinaceusdrappus]